MDMRYRLLHDKGVRNIDSYNRLLRESGAGEAETGDDPPEGGDVLVHRHLPRIVIIIDELADLMLTVGREIEEAITRLPPGARRVFVLHDVEGYKHEEIAEMLGVTSGATKAQLHRARLLLREALNR